MVGHWYAIAVLVQANILTAGGKLIFIWYSNFVWVTIDWKNGEFLVISYNISWISRKYDLNIEHSQDIDWYYQYMYGLWNHSTVEAASKLFNNVLRKVLVANGERFLHEENEFHIQWQSLKESSILNKWLNNGRVESTKLYKLHLHCVCCAADCGWDATLFVAHLPNMNWEYYIESK